jgi:hypothetical protein
MLGAPLLRVGVDLSVYAHQGIRAQSIYAIDFVAQPPMDISGYAWAMLDDFLYAIELLAPKGAIDLYLIFVSESKKERKRHRLSVEIKRIRLPQTYRNIFIAGSHIKNRNYKNLCSNVYTQITH